MDTIKDLISRYGTDFESVRNDIVSGIKEGFEEGIKEGIKKGFCDGIKDCLKFGFFNMDKIKIKSFNKILADAFGNASEKSISNVIKKTVKRECKSIVDPSIKKYMEKACNTVTEEIKSSKVQLEGGNAKEIKNLLNLSIKKIKEKIGKITNDVREKLPTDVIFGSVVDGIQENLEETFNENIEICKERVNREIDTKITPARI